MRVGLTGGVASGKSTVAAMLAELGAVVIDADLMSRELGLEPTAWTDTCRATATGSSAPALVP